MKTVSTSENKAYIMFFSLALLAACFSQAAAAYSCSDTDGLNTTLRGRTNSSYDNVQHYDACVNSTTVLEWACDSQALAYNTTISCGQYPCSSGSCDRTTIKITALKISVNGSIDSLIARGLKVGLVAFSQYFYSECPEGICWSFALGTNASPLYAQIGLYHPMSGTCVSCGIKKATDMFSGATGGKYMVLLTDGLPQLCLPNGTTCSSNSSEWEYLAKNESKQKAIEAYAAGIKVYTVAIGDTQDQSNMLNYNFLTEVAAVGGGKAYNAACQASLQTILQTIGGNEAQNNIVYVSDVSGSMTQEFNISCGTTTSTTTTTSTSTTSSSSSSTQQTTTTSTITSSTSTSTSTSTTTTTGDCQMPGNNSPCGEVTLSEAVAAIQQWNAGNMTLGSLVDLITSWADPSGHPPY